MRFLHTSYAKIVLAIRAGDPYLIIIARDTDTETTKDTHMSFTIRKSKTNSFEVQVSNKKGMAARILFSYETPVAAMVLIQDQPVVFKTEKRHSKTTSKHINEWMSQWTSPLIVDKPQEFFDKLAE